MIACAEIRLAAPLNRNLPRRPASSMRLRRGEENLFSGRRRVVLLQRVEGESNCRNPTLVKVLMRQQKNT